jgi:hypothetical protein
MKRLALFVLAGTLAGLFVGATLPMSIAHELNPAAQLSTAALAGADEKAQSFMGHIAQAEGKYVLVDDGQRATFQLDDQEKAKQFDGKKVKVIGSLDPATNTIHVADIVAV